MADYLENPYDLKSSDLIDVLDETPFWSAPFGIQLLDAIQYKKGIHALDIGFGTGFPLTEIAMRFGNSSKVYGIDPWDAAVKRAKKKIDFYQIKNTELICSIAEDIPLPTGSIDLIVSNNGLNNVKNLDQCLNECSRIIKSGGQFVQTVNLEETMMTFYNVLESVMCELGLTQQIEIVHRHIHEKRQPIDSYVSKIKSKGFTLESVNNYQFEYKFVDGTTMFHHYFIRLAFFDSWKALVPENLHNKVFDEVEKKLNEQSEKKGYLSLLVPFAVIDCKKE